MTTGWRSYLFSVAPARAITEMLLTQAGITLLTITLVQSFSSGYGEVLPTLIILGGPGCLFWCAVRMQWPTGRWWQQGLYEAAIALALGLLMVAIILGLVLFATIVTPLLAGSLISSELATLLVSNFRHPDWFRVLRDVLAGIGPFVCSMFFCMRAGLRLVLYWNRLRRTRIRWALTHAHLLVALLGAALISALIIAVDIGFSPRRDVLQLLPILFILLILTCIGLAIVMPPSAIFSYFFARRMTRRLETLTKATTALRAGDYSMRVAVQGEDEIAHLQADFNAMAEAHQRAMRELQAERDNVATLLKARRELIASVSHELRTPVATLRGYLESTRVHWDETPPPTLQRDLEVMEQETIRLQALINDLFTLARAEVGRLEMRCEPTDVGAAALRVVETMAPLAWQSGRVEIVADVSPETSFAQADIARLEQVLQNLVHNAVRHTPPGGIVAVSAQAGPDTVILQVKDTGEGIEPCELPHIWERFYRTRRASEHPGSGTGLGLALVKELTETMGGSVAVESILGEGSCFTIRLPRAESNPRFLPETSDIKKVVEAA